VLDDAFAIPAALGDELDGVPFMSPVSENARRDARIELFLASAVSRRGGAHRCPA